MKKKFTTAFFVLIGLVIVSVLFFTIRQWQVNSQIEREWQAQPATFPKLGTTTRLEILPLYEEDRADKSFDFGHGVSYLIRTDSATIMMDIGNNPSESAQLPSLKNMQMLGVLWQDIDAIVITHPHPDHTGGVKAWQNKTLAFGEFAGDLSKMPVYSPIHMNYSAANMIYSAEPTLISPDVATTGVLSYPEVFPLSISDPKGYEQGLVIHIAGQGLVLITGCGHPTIEKLISRAEAMFGQQVVGVVGGLHYETVSKEELQSHIQFIESRRPKFIALSSHDSSPEALAAFQSAFPKAYQFVRVGEAIQFP